MKNVITRLEDRYPVTLFFALCLIIAWPFIVLRGWAEAGRAGDGVLFYFLAALPVFVSQFSPTIVASLLVRNRYGTDGLRPCII